MIKVKKYNEEQLAAVQDNKHFNELIDNLTYLALREDLNLSRKRADMFKILILYMSSRKSSLINVGISKRDADNVVKEELKTMNLVLKEFKNAIPKDN